jgi:hypothetical protein
MKTDLLKFALAFFAVSVFLANCADAQKIPVDKSGAQDLSTDAGIIAELQKIIDGKNAESTGDEKLDAKRKNASKLEAKDVCIKRLKESAEIIVIGFFRTDDGCHLDGVFVDSRYFERDKFDLSKIALAALGWEKASQKERENLAKLWVEKGLLVFAPLTNQTLSAFSTADGSVKVTASSKYPPGVTSRSAAKSFVFNKDGELLSASGY